MTTGFCISTQCTLVLMKQVERLLKNRLVVPPISELPGLELEKIMISTFCCDIISLLLRHCQNWAFRKWGDHCGRTSLSLLAKTRHKNMRHSIWDGKQVSGGGCCYLLPNRRKTAESPCARIFSIVVFGTNEPCMCGHINQAACFRHPRFWQTTAVWNTLFK